jgi:hypothetical protein
VNDEELADLLLADLEETLDTEAEVPLYGFSWFLRGQDPDIDDSRRLRLIESAYATLRSRHALRLVWMAWPWTYVSEAPDDTPLEFEIDEEGDDPYLVLVPVGRQFDEPHADQPGREGDRE